MGDSITGFYNFMPAEAGYDELRRVFDFLVKDKQVGPDLAGNHGDLKNGEVSITVVDADDLLDNPEGIISAYCKEVGIDFTPHMLNWETEDAEWRGKYGVKGAKVIRECVKANIPDYEYL